MRNQVLGCIGLIALAITVNSCSSSTSSSASKALSFTAKPLNALTGGSGSSLMKNVAHQALGIDKSSTYSTGTPTGDEYYGMGQHHSLAQIEGFKVYLTKVSFGTGTPGQSGGTISTAFDWSASPKELEVAGGITESISDAGALADGVYKYVSVNFLAKYKIKSFACLDTDSNGSIDKVVYTTASGVTSTSTATCPATGAALTGYDYFQYGFMYPHCSNSLTASTSECGTFSVFPEPFDTTSSTSLSVTLMIDPTRVAIAWDGSFGSTAYDGTNLASANLTGVSSQLPTGGTCTQTPNSYGKTPCDFFPASTPAFALEYLPAFALANTSGLSFQIYAVSSQSGSFHYYNSTTMWIVFSGTKPLFGLIGVADGDKHPKLGSVARIFEETTTAGTFNFYMDYRMTDSSGVNDGGLYYNNDKTMAGFVGYNFTPATAVGGTGSFEVGDGPRCNGEYNYCCGASSRVACSNTTSGVSTRTVYFRRLK